MARQKMAVIGLGQFGLNLALRLTEQGVEVLGIDVNEERVEMLRDQIAHTIIMDSTDKRALAQTGIKDFDDDDIEILYSCLSQRSFICRVHDDSMGYLVS